MFNIQHRKGTNLWYPNSFSFSSPSLTYSMYTHHNLLFIKREWKFRWIDNSCRMSFEIGSATKCKRCGELIGATGEIHIKEAALIKKSRFLFGLTGCERTQSGGPRLLGNNWFSPAGVWSHRGFSEDYSFAHVHCVIWDAHLTKKSVRMDTKWRSQLERISCGVIRSCGFSQDIPATLGLKRGKPRTIWIEA